MHFGKIVLERNPRLRPNCIPKRFRVYVRIPVAVTADP